MKKLLLLFIPINALAIPERELKPAEVEIPILINKEDSALNATEEKTRLTEELINSPHLVKQMLNRAIDTGQYHLLDDLISIYQKTDHPDDILIDYSKAIVFSQQGQYHLAIAIYRKIISQYPNFHPVRLRLAQALFEDNQNEAALEQFNKLRTEKIPQSINTLVNQYISSIQKRSDWEFGFGITYLREDNVNNASKEQYISLNNILFKKSEDDLPQKANGINYQLSISKNFHLKANHSLYFDNFLNGKSYWDNHSFDDIQNRSSFGYQYQNAKTKWKLLPFYERRWYAGHRHNYGYGIRSEYQHWLTRHWQVSIAGELGRLKHRENNILDGNNLLGSFTLLYAFNSRSYIYSGIDWLEEHTITPNLSSTRITARIGWGQEWWQGISTRIQFSQSKRKFQGTHSLFQTIRQDKEQDLSVTLWHRNVYFWGITPKLTFNRHQVKSNLDSLYSYKRNRIYLNFEKTF